LQDKRDEILRIAAAHGAQNVWRVFGSISRGEGGLKSDIDLLVKLEPRAKPSGPHRDQTRPRRLARARS